MRQIVAKLKTDLNTDKQRNIDAVKMLAKDFTVFKYDAGDLKNDTIAAKQTELYVQSLMNRLKALKSKTVSQKNIETANKRQIDSYMVEIHKKYSIPFACIVFVLIGAPLGIITRRGGFGVAAGMSLGFFLLYWAFLIGGEKLADREMLSPFLSMWSANFILGLAGVYLTFKNSISIKQIKRAFKSKY
jgi:lipopolysaccharide export system permease protein